MKKNLMNILFNENYNYNNIFRIIILYYIFIIPYKYNSNFLLKLTMKPFTKIFNYDRAYNKIPISYALNNGNIYLTLISITSILENANNNTYYLFYIMISHNKTEFSNENKRRLKYFERKYFRCKVYFLEMNDTKFEYARVNRYPVPTYYRLLLAKLCPHINKIIYLDGDTIILTDLLEMLNLNMNNNIVMGFLDNAQRFAKMFGIKTNYYVTAGVILLDLEKIRKENITEKFFNFMKVNQNKLKQEDQTVINIVLHKRVGFLPAKYGLWTFYNKTQFFFHNHYQNYTNIIQCYSDSEMDYAWNHPSILHFVMQKPYHQRYYLSNSTFVNYWIYYAGKTREYYKIIKYYNLSLLKHYKLIKNNDKYFLKLI